MTNRSTRPSFPTVNEKILERSIRHGAYLQLFAAGQARRIIEFLERQVYPDVVGRLSSHLGRIRSRGIEIDWRAKNLAEMMRAVNKVVRTGVLLSRQQLAADLSRLALSEAEFQVAMLRQTVPLSFDWTTPSPQQMKAIVTRRPMQGRLMREWFTDLDRNTRARVARELRIGMTAGEPNSRIVQRIRGTRANGFRDGVLNATTRQANTIVRTATSSVANAAQREVWEANSDVITKVQWVLTLDSRTCIRCIGREAESPWPIDKAPPPPEHPLCRCVLNPVPVDLSGFGLNTDALPEATRASINGEVPESVTFPQFLKTQSREVQNRVLGTERAKLWRSGEVEIRDMRDARGRIMLLDELRRREGLVQP